MKTRTMLLIAGWQLVVLALGVAGAWNSIHEMLGTSGGATWILNAIGNVTGWVILESPLIVVLFVLHVRALRNEKQPGFCQKCGYDLRPRFGVGPDSCPECGWGRSDD